MSQKGFKVEPDALIRSANVIDEKTAKYNSEVKNIYSAVENLRVEWKGQASNIFNEKLEEYRNDFNELSKTLNDYSNFLKQAANNYTSVDARLASEAQKLIIGK